HSVQLCDGIVDSVVKLVGVQQLADAASAFRDLVGKLLQLSDSAVRAIVELWIVDDLSDRSFSVLNRSHDVVHPVQDYIQFVDGALAGLENVLQGWGFGGCQFVIVLYRKPLGTGTVNVNEGGDRKSTRLNSSHQIISYAVFCLKK